MYMGGVDKSDQLISYHRMTHQTKRYWKTLSYHLMKIAATNAFIFHKFYRIEVGKRETTKSHFRDQLVLQIEKCGLPLLSVVVPASMQHRVSHGGKSLSVQQRSQCVICAQKTI